MDREYILAILHSYEAKLRSMGVASLAIFGSVARGDASAESDIDLLVEFSRPVGLFEFIRLKLFLEQATGHEVDLVTPDALRPSMSEDILREAIYVC